MGLPAAAAPKAKRVPVRYTPANSQIVIFADHPTDELRMAAASVGLPVKWRESSGKERTVAVIGRGGSWNFAGMEGSQNPEGYQVVNRRLDLIIMANSQRGVANGLYDFRRSLLASARRDEVDVTRLLSQGVSKPAFAHRATYTFLAPWNLPKLNGARVELGPMEDPSGADAAAGRQPVLFRPVGKPVLPSRLSRDAWRTKPCTTACGRFATTPIGSACGPA